MKTAALAVAVFLAVALVGFASAIGGLYFYAFCLADRGLPWAR